MTPQPTSSPAKSISTHTSRVCTASSAGLLGKAGQKRSGVSLIDTDTVGGRGSIASSTVLRSSLLAGKTRITRCLFCAATAWLKAPKQRRYNTKLCAGWRPSSASRRCLSHCGREIGNKPSVLERAIIKPVSAGTPSQTARTLSVNQRLQKSTSKRTPPGLSSSSGCANNSSVGKLSSFACR